MNLCNNILGVIKEPRNTAVEFNGVDIPGGYLKTNFWGGQTILIHGYNETLKDFLDLTVPGASPITFRFSINGVQKL